MGSGYVSHRRTSSFNHLYDHGFVVFKDVQLGFTLRRMCVGGNVIHFTQLLNLLSSFDMLGLDFGRVATWRLAHQQKWRVIVRRDWLSRLVKMVGRKDERSGSTITKTPSLNERHKPKTRLYQNHSVDLLLQMTLLCQTVQSLGKQMQDVQNLGRQMQDGFAAESRRRQEDYN